MGHSVLRLCACAITVWALLSALDAPAAAAVHGRVLHVVDGAMLDVLVGQKRTRVRLTSIEVPEAGRPYAHRSRQSLIQVCGGEVAEIHAAGKDPQGRLLARVVCNRTDANAEQVRRGMAWLADRGAVPGSPLYAVQEDARSAHRGLWAGAQTIP